MPLVTGGAGFIGSNLVDRLLAEGHSVDVVDDLSSASLANLADARPRRRAVDFTFHHLDIRAPELVGARRAPAARGGLPPGRAGRRPGVGREAVFDAEVNILGSLNVLEAARAAGAARSCSRRVAARIYGDVDPSDLPVKESHASDDPLSPYGVAKKVVADYLTAYRELHQLEFTALALANVYGPTPEPPRRGRRGLDLHRAAARRAAVHDLRRRRVRRVTSCTSTTSSTRSSARHRRAAACS